jgi:hypothetical protein
MSLHLSDSLPQHFILGLGREDFETLDQGKTRIDHRAELPRKYNQIFISKTGPKAEFTEIKPPAALFCKARDDNTLLAELIHRLISGFRA